MNMRERFRVASSGDADADGGDKIDLRQMQDFFWRRWKLIVAAAAVVMALTFLILLTLTPRYTATAQVLLDPRKEKIFGQQATMSELNLESANVDTQISVIHRSICCAASSTRRS